MLLPSALTCDSSAPSQRTRYQASLFASPPLSPPPSSSHPAITNLYSTCRALQSMLTQPNQLPSPPTTHAEPPSSPFKLKLRARKGADEQSANGGVMPRKRITKRSHTTPPPRGANKRRRAIDDDMSRETEELSEDNDSEMDEPVQPSTPKRLRLAPEVLPLGLERSDFHALRLQQMTAEGHGEEVLQSVEGEDNNEEWNEDDDRVLVELVLTKLKLTKSDWQDCARSLGKDRGSVGKRWKSLMSAGDVGLKRPRRSRIHGTWR